MVGRSFRNNNFSYLFTGLLLLLLLEPVRLSLPDAAWGSVTSGFAFELLLILGVWSLVDSRRWFRTGIALAAIAVTISLLAVVSGRHELRYASLFVALVFCVISAGAASRRLLLAERIGANEIIGSACVYMLLGVIWAVVYIFVLGLEANAFENLTAAPLKGEVAELLYFSFVTLTTLGYGDILPVSPLARVLAALEAIAGQLYLTILVAALVGRHLSSRAESSGVVKNR